MNLTTTKIFLIFIALAGASIHALNFDYVFNTDGNVASATPPAAFFQTFYQDVSPSNANISYNQGDGVRFYSTANGVEAETSIFTNSPQEQADFIYTAVVELPSALDSRLATDESYIAIDVILFYGPSQTTAYSNEIGAVFASARYPSEGLTGRFIAGVPPNNDGPGVNITPTSATRIKFVLTFEAETDRLTIVGYDVSSGADILLGTVLDQTLPAASAQFFHPSVSYSTGEGNRTPMVNNNADAPNLVSASFQGTVSSYQLSVSADSNQGYTSYDGTSSFAPGTEIDIEAYPYYGYAFTGWTGDISSADNPLRVTMNSNINLVANFAELDRLEAYANVGGSVDPGGDNFYPGGTEVVVTATPFPGFIFDNWTGDVTGTANPITVTVDGSIQIYANFTQDLSDADEDGLTAYQERTIYFTSPDLKDSNNDGIEDGQAVNLGVDPATDYTALIDYLGGGSGGYTLEQLRSLAVGTVLERGESDTFIMTFDFKDSLDLKSFQNMDLDLARDQARINANGDVEIEFTPDVSPDAVFYQVEIR